MFPRLIWFVLSPVFELFLQTTCAAAAPCKSSFAGRSHVEHSTKGSTCYNRLCRITLVDFGCARFVGPASHVGDDNGSDRVPMSPVGTPAYQPPEVNDLIRLHTLRPCSSNRPATWSSFPAIDMYGAGAVLHAMFFQRLLPGAREGLEKLRNEGYHRTYRRTPEFQALLHRCRAAANLLDCLLDPAPARRPTARAALQHAWLQDVAACVRAESQAAVERSMRGAAEAAQSSTPSNTMGWQRCPRPLCRSRSCEQRRPTARITPKADMPPCRCGVCWRTSVARRCPVALRDGVTRVLKIFVSAIARISGEIPR